LQGKTRIKTARANATASARVYSELVAEPSGPPQTGESGFVFKLALTKTLNKQWNEVYSHNFLSAKAYSEDIEEIQGRIREQWKHFLESDLPLLVKFSLA